MPSNNFEAWPEDTDTKIYICYGLDLEDLLELIKKKWPNAKPDEINIESEEIQVDHLSYDLHDGSDWRTFTVIEYKKKEVE